MGRVATVRLIGIALTATAALGARGLESVGVRPGRAPALETIARELGGRTSRAVPVDERARAQLRSDALLLRRYETPTDLPVWLFLDYHESQRLGATVHSPRVCYPGAGWDVQSTEAARVPTADAGTRPARWLALRRGDERMVALYWYVSRWGETDHELRLKADIVRSAATRRPTDAAVVRLSTPVGPDGPAAARARLLDFLAVADAEIARALPFAPLRPSGPPDGSPPAEQPR